MNKKFKKLAYILITLSLIMFTFILNITGIFAKIENQLIDFRLSFSKDKVIYPGIVRLYMDDLETYKLGSYRSYTHLENGKLSRNELSKLIEKLEKSEPTLIILDFNLETLENDSFNSNNPDLNLAKTLKKYDNIILSTHLNKNQEENTEFTDYSSINKTNAILDVLVEDKDYDPENTYSVNESRPMLFTENEFLTISNIESVDKKVREIKPIYKIAEKDLYLPSSAFYAFLRLKNKTNSRIVIKNKKLNVDNISFRLNNSYNLFLNLKDKKIYYPSYPIGAILKAIYEKDDVFTFDNKNVNFSNFKNKIIILEEDTANVTIKELPNGEKYTNGEIMALELDNYLAYSANPSLKNQFPVTGSLFIELALSLIFCAFVVLSKIKTHTNYMGFVFTFMFVLMAIVYYLQTKVLLAMAIPLYCMLSLSIINTFFDKYSKSNKQEILKSTYRQHLSKEMLNKLAKNMNKISLKPKMQFITVLYCRIEDFTRLTKNVDADILIKRLNEILDIIVTSSFRNKGTVNKVNSSSVVVYFGAPISDGSNINDAQNATRTAIDIWNKVNALNKKYGDFSFDLKISLHSGEALVGEIGTNSFSGYSAFGDTIDLVAQISKISSKFEKSLLISQATYDLLKEQNISSLTDKDIELAYAGAIAIKSDATSRLSLYEIRELSESATDEDS